MEEILKKCTMCPHKCNVNRYETVGRCKATANVKVSLVSTHDYEEPPISGTNGSGTIFFTGCNLGCVYCQNYEISHNMYGKEISINRLADIMLEQQKRGVHNINLVTPTIYAYQIKEAIKIAKQNGLRLPIVYNTSGYESIDTLKILEGYIDIYLPDLKYYYDELGKKYSNVNNYFEIATNAIKEMYRQVGSPKLNENGIMKKGLMIRHLVLPNNIENSKMVLKWIKENIDNNVYISIMAQYFPTYKAKNVDELSRKLTKQEYEEIENYLYDLDLENGYIQELGEHEEEYVPKWECN